MRFTDWFTDASRWTQTSRGSICATPLPLSTLEAGPFDVVFHAAANVDPSVPAKTMFDINLGGTINLLRWVKQQGCSHFVQISSVSVYGNKASGRNRSEASTARSRYIGLPYSRSKAAAEIEVERSGVPYTILRLPMVIGSGDGLASPRSSMPFEMVPSSCRGRERRSAA